MVSYNKAVMALLRRMGTRKERALSQLPYTLLHELSHGTYKTAARHAFHWERELARNSRDEHLKEIMEFESATTGEERVWSGNVIPLVQQIPCLLLCMQLSPPTLGTYSSTLLSRLALSNCTVRGRAPHVNAIFAAILMHLLPRPFTEVPTVNLIFAVVAIGNVRIASINTEQQARRGECARGIPPWIRKQNVEVRKCLEELPRWLQALFPTTDSLDLAGVIDEIARRLPPADEALPGDYVDVLAARAIAESAEGDSSTELKVMSEQSTKSAVTPAELMVLVSHLLSLSGQFNRIDASTQLAQKSHLLDFWSRVDHKPFYSAFARAALRGALLNLSLLRHTEKILTARVPSVPEWLFMISVVTGGEKGWASTAYSAMRTMLRLAEERRRDEAQRSGKAERVLSLFGPMGEKNRFLLLNQYASAMYKLRFEVDLFYDALECTKPLLQECFRELEADTTSSLRALDAKYRVRQLLFIVTRADNVKEGGVGEDAEDVGGDDKQSVETPPVGESERGGEVTPSLLKPLEKFFAEPTFTSFFPPEVGAPSVPAKGGSGFAQADLPDSRDRAAGSVEGVPSDELALCMQVVECAIVHCISRCTQAANIHEAPSGLIELSLRSAHRMQRITRVYLRYISSAIQRCHGNSHPASVYDGMPPDERMDWATVGDMYGEVKTLQLSWLIVRLLSILTTRKDLSLTEQTDIADIASAVMSDWAGFLDLISDIRELPSSLNRNLAVLLRWYTAHKQFLKCSAAAADAPSFRAVEENVRKVVISSLGAVQRVYSTLCHRRARAGAAPASSFDLGKSMATSRLLDCCVSLALAANMMLVELPHIADVVQKAFDEMREAVQAKPQVSPSDKQCYDAERNLRCSFLLKTIHFLHHVCTLSLFDEGCLDAAASAVKVCAGEDCIAAQSWKSRCVILSRTSYIFRILIERFAHSRASRDLAHQLLIMLSRLALDRLVYREPLLAAQKQQREGRGGDVELHKLQCTVFMWQVSCMVASTMLPNVPIDKYLGIMHTHIRRNFVISLNVPGMGELKGLRGPAMLEYCERLLGEAMLKGEKHVLGERAATMEAVIVRCNVLMRDVFFYLKLVTDLMCIDSSPARTQAIRLRWIQQAELAWRLLKRYQRWIAPSVWRSVWMEVGIVMTVMRIGHISSLDMQEAADTALVNLIRFSKIRGNKGVWVKHRSARAAASEGDGDGATETSAAKENVAGTPQLLSFSVLSRMFEVQERLTDMKLRVYLVELMDQASRETERNEAAVADSRSDLDETRRRSFSGLMETQREREQRHIRSARVNILFTCRRMRS
ncbi:hypothetical protein LSCM1_00588 [Leishmania martiniquensis]|uniref:Uncharacterized protein n=1 Tax=Leishmania martiniquensis TaxID=1580590 RepID=A0A836K622_9TRYP|nr:hypothetical protein LSCM1_00588 [Leishmania martiniquensis]